jgi:hypothetical protein
MLCVLVIALTVHAQAAPGIPFEYKDGLIWVKVHAKGHEEPLNFLLDSGAGVSVLSLDTARKLSVKLGGTSRVQRVEAGAVAWEVTGFEARLAGVSLSESPLALDLRATSALCSRPIDGLIGQDFFRGRIVQIDFKARRIRLLEKSDASQCCAVLSLKLHRDIMCVPASVNGSTQKWLRLDTGCDEGLHWVSGLAAGKNSVMTSLQLGDEKLSGVRTTLHRSEMFPDEAGLLGNGILSNYIVTIDGVQKKLLLERS